MGTYLENYLESMQRCISQLTFSGVSSLPQEVRRNFALLRDLDTRAQGMWS